MDFKVRLMKMDRLISEKGVVTFEELQRATGAAPATGDLWVKLKYMGLLKKKDLSVER